MNKKASPQKSSKRKSLYEPDKVSFMVVVVVVLSIVLFAAMGSM